MPDLIALQTAAKSASDADAAAQAAVLAAAKAVADLQAKVPAAQAVLTAVTTAQQQLADAQAKQAATKIRAAQAQAAVDAVPVDLAPLLKAAKPGDVIAPGAASYVLNETLDYKIANVTVDLSNAPLAETPSPGASSDIIVHAPNFTAKQWNVTRGCVGFRVYAPFAKFLSCHFDNETSAILTGENGTDMLMQDCTLGANFGAVPVYVTSDRASFIRTKFGGAKAEYDLRWDNDSNGRTPVGALVQDCEFWNTAAFGKDTVGFRMIHGMRFNNSKVHGDIRIGQVAKSGPPLTPTSCCADCIIDTCQFDKITRGGGGLRIMEGATVTLLNPEFWGDGQTDWISIDAGSELVVKNPILHLPPGVNPKPIVSALATGKWTSDPVKVFNDCTPDRLAA